MDGFEGPVTNINPAAKDLFMSSRWQREQYFIIKSSGDTRLHIHDGQI